VQKVDIFSESEISWCCNSFGYSAWESRCTDSLRKLWSGYATRAYGQPSAIPVMHVYSGNRCNFTPAL